MTNKIIAIILVILVAFGVGYVISNKDESPTQNNTADNANSGTNGAALDLSGQQLTSLPTSVTGRADVVSLNLSNNQLTNLPAAIANMTNLEVLNIENNRIESLPAEMNQLTNLRQILANNNRMNGTPTVLSAMTWLEVLDISGNNIPSGEITELKSRLPDTQIKP